MDVPTGTLLEGVDLSNWQGLLTAERIQALRSAGKAFAIVRLSTEDDTRRNIAIQQCEALIEAGIPTLGYAWCYWWQDPAGAMASSIVLARRCGVSIVALDMEDDPADVDVRSWVTRAVRTLEMGGVLPLLYTDPNWWIERHLDFAPLADVRWWVAQYNGVHTLEAVTPPFAGARVVGHQYADRSDVPQFSTDSDVLMFDQEMAAALRPQGGSDMDEATVRLIIDARLNEITTAMGQGADFKAFVQALLARVNAAGKALDLDMPVPGSMP